MDDFIYNISKQLEQKCSEKYKKEEFPTQDVIDYLTLKAKGYKKSEIIKKLNLGNQ